MVKQGDIIWVSFDPALGHEQKKMRPALIISNNAFNTLCGNMVTALPISHAKEFPLHIDLPAGMQVDGKVLCDQIKTLDLQTRKYQVIDHVNDIFLQQIIEIMCATLTSEEL